MEFTFLPIVLIHSVYKISKSQYLIASLEKYKYVKQIVKAYVDEKINISSDEMINLTNLMKKMVI